MTVIDFILILLLILAILGFFAVSKFMVLLGILVVLFYFAFGRRRL